MSFSISAVSQNSPYNDTDPAPKPAPKLTEAEQIKQLAEQGRSNQQIATATGLPVTLVDTTLGDSTTSSSSATSSASALVALSGRLSVYG
jgi:hypothetical protein